MLDLSTFHSWCCHNSPRILSGVGGKAEIRRFYSSTSTELSSSMSIEWSTQLAWNYCAVYLLMVTKSVQHLLSLRCRDSSSCTRRRERASKRIYGKHLAKGSIAAVPPSILVVGTEGNVPSGSFEQVMPVCPEWVAVAFIWRIADWPRCYCRAAVTLKCPVL